MARDSTPTNNKEILMEETVIISGARTPIARFGGSFVDVPAVDLGSVVIKAALERAGVKPEQVDHVIMGCVGQTDDETHAARLAALRAGLPNSVSALNVNRICGSGLEAINTAARYIETGDADVVVAGGMENMSQLPYLLPKARWGLRMNDAVLQDQMIVMLSCPVNLYHMGVTAENLAEKF